jgi:acyl transferase domain-containing protein/NAD(P)-dependent dehydrogenase (short-subunit alcohol dehydrogenase family)
MGCMFPRAEDVTRYWANIRDRVDAITDVPESHWRADDYHDQDPKAHDRTYSRRGGFLSPVDFPPLDFGIAPHSIEATDTTQLLGLLIAKQALDDAGYPTEREFDRDKVSVILGISGTLELVIPLSARLGQPIWRRALHDSGVLGPKAEAVIERIASSYVGWQENSFPGLLGNVAAGRIANRLDLHGTNCVVDAACASSLGAIDMALLELSAGRCDLAVTGGIDTFNDIFVYMCFSKTPALSPTGEARPFDSLADGTILGEGLGMLVLKRLDDARRDGDRIYAVIRSIGTSSDGKGQAVYAPSAAGQVKALRRAYELSGIGPETVELVEAHGTGTRVGDATELQALEEVYGIRPEGPWCALGSVKSQIGHTKAAAGSAGLIKAALALHHKVLPPTTKVERPIERLAEGRSPFYLNTQARPWLTQGGHPRRAAVSAFGFGGSNFHCVLEEAAPEKTEIDWDGDVQILAYSSDRPDGLFEQLKLLDPLADWSEIRAEGSRSRSAYERDRSWRMLLVARRGQSDWGEQKAAARARLEASLRSRTISADLPRPAPQSGERTNVYFGSAAPSGKLAFLFPGQGSQYTGMLRELACRFPRMHESLALSNGFCEAEDLPISSRIYPRSVFTDRERLELEHALRETRYAQPAIGAVSLGLLLILEDFGVRPELTGGHSFGELTALRAAGRLSDRSFASLAAKRGQLMTASERNGESGAMLAVFAALEDVREVLEHNSLELVIANKNAPRQCVVSGPAAEIERSGQIFAARKIATQPLGVSRAFHSRLVSGAEASFLGVLESITFTPSPIPVFSNTTALPYPADPGSARAVLAGQLAQPVEFVAQVEEMYRMGARTFLEIGPDSKLSSLVRAILEGQDHRAIAVDASRGSAGNVYDLACTLASLAAEGHAVDLTRWDGDWRPAPAKRPGLTVKVCGANPRPKPAAPPADAGKLNGRQSVGDSKPVAVVPSHTMPPVAARSRDSVNTRPLDHLEIERTMKPIEEASRHHANGQGHSHHLTRLIGAEQRAASPLPAASRELPPSAGFDLALQNARESLIALQRMSEQTANLHCQFLEGQEKTQQAFMKLLEHEQRLSWAMLGSPEPEAHVSNAPAAFVSPFPDAGPLGPAATARFDPDVTEEVRSSTQRTEANGDVHATLGARMTPTARAPDSSASSGSLAAIVIEIVSEKTGYPANVLDLDMQLDADLGIDSIKRVEILSALQDRLPLLPTMSPELLGTLRTLRSIVDQIGDARCAEADQATKPDAVACAADADASQQIARVLLETVADKTGYPVAMLELDMRLDTDLGIDSIKRVEIFSAIQDELAGAHAAGPEEIGTLGTLRDIVSFLGRSTRAATGLESQPKMTTVPGSPEDLPMARVLLESVAKKTGFPIDMLDLDMQLDVDLGIDSIKRVEIFSAVQDQLPHARAMGPEQLGSLRTLRQVAEFLSSPSEQKTEAESRKTELASAKPVVLRTLYPTPRALELPDRRDPVTLRTGGTVWITDDGSPLPQALERRLTERGYAAKVISLDVAPPPAPLERLCGLIVLAPKGSTDHGLLRNAFRIMRAAAPALEESAAEGGASFMTVSRLDGSFGLSGLAANVSPISGALAALAKTAGREWKAVNCKAIDVDAAFDVPEGAARVIVDELHKRGPDEIGLTRQCRTVVELEPDAPPALVQQRGRVLVPGDVVVISGGARGITAEVAVALASAFQPRLVVLGRSPSPGPEEDWLAGIDDEPGLKRGLTARSSRRLSPQELTQESRRLLAEREVRRNLERIASAGSPVVYHSVDVRDGAHVRAAIARAQQEFGPVRGLVHGAGVLADRKIVDQTDDQFDLVYGTKVEGIHHLWNAIDPASLALLVLFSSSSARFGRAGQVAYAAANEYLNKWAEQQALLLPSCRVVSFNWGPWAGGMVTGALKPIFEQEGIALIPLDSGAKLVVDEARRGEGSAVELVVVAEPAHAKAPASRAPATVSLSPTREVLQTVFRRELDLESVPVLSAHVIDGHPVLPVALILEWMAEAAIHRNPGLSICGVDDFRLFKGVILGHQRPATVELRAGKPVRRDAQFAVPIELCGTLANGKDVVHARAVIVLGDRREASGPRLTETELSRYPLMRDEIYQAVLFHGPLMQGIESVVGCGERGIAGWVLTAPSTSDWIDRPLRSNWLIDPLAIDSAFQLVGLWTREMLGANSLPTGLGSLRLFQRDFPEQSALVLIEIEQSSPARATAAIEILDEERRLVARLDNFECVIDASLNQAFRRNQLSSQFSVVSS